jgi:tetratricopeptide (TPR) repeat protein
LTIKDANTGKRVVIDTTAGKTDIGNDSSVLFAYLNKGCEILAISRSLPELAAFLNKEGSSINISWGSSWGVAASAQASSGRSGSYDGVSWGDSRSSSFSTGRSSGTSSAIPSGGSSWYSVSSYSDYSPYYLSSASSSLSSTGENSIYSSFSSLFSDYSAGSSWTLPSTSFSFVYSAFSSSFDYAFSNTAPTVPSFNIVVTNNIPSFSFASFSSVTSRDTFSASYDTNSRTLFIPAQTIANISNVLGKDATQAEYEAAFYYLGVKTWRESQDSAFLTDNNADGLTKGSESAYSAVLKQAGQSFAGGKAGSQEWDKGYSWLDAGRKLLEAETVTKSTESMQLYSAYSMSIGNQKFLEAESAENNGDYAKASEKYTEAAKEFELAFNTEQGGPLSNLVDASLITLIGETYSKIGETEKALELCSLALEHTSNYKPAQFLLAQLQEGNAGLGQENVVEPRYICESMSLCLISSAFRDNPVGAELEGSRVTAVIGDTANTATGSAPEKHVRITSLDEIGSEAADIPMIIFAAGTGAPGQQYAEGTDIQLGTPQEPLTLAKDTELTTEGMTTKVVNLEFGEGSSITDSQADKGLIIAGSNENVKLSRIKAGGTLHIEDNKDLTAYDLAAGTDIRIVDSEDSAISGIEAVAGSITINMVTGSDLAGIVSTAGDVNIEEVSSSTVNNIKAAEGVSLNNISGSTLADLSAEAGSITVSEISDSGLSNVISTAGDVNIKDISSSTVNNIKAAEGVSLNNISGSTLAVLTAEAGSITFS